ncbi:unnamed protein product [Discosporangium mesarthrocarpum]
MAPSIPLQRRDTVHDPGPGLGSGGTVGAGENVGWGQGGAGLRDECSQVEELQLELACMTDRLTKQTKERYMLAEAALEAEDRAACLRGQLQALQGIAEAEGVGQGKDQEAKKVEGSIPLDVQVMEVEVWKFKQDKEDAEDLASHVCEELKDTQKQVEALSLQQEATKESLLWEQYRRAQAQCQLDEEAMEADKMKVALLVAGSRAEISRSKLKEQEMTMKQTQSSELSLAKRTDALIREAFERQRRLGKRVSLMQQGIKESEEDLRFLFFHKKSLEETLEEAGSRSREEMAKLQGDLEAAVTDLREARGGLSREKEEVERLQHEFREAKEAAEDLRLMAEGERMQRKSLERRLAEAERTRDELAATAAKAREESEKTRRQSLERRLAEAEKARDRLATVAQAGVEEEKRRRVSLERRLGEAERAHNDLAASTAADRASTAEMEEERKRRESLERRLSAAERARDELASSAVTDRANTEVMEEERRRRESLERRLGEAEQARHELAATVAADRANAKEMEGESRRRRESLERRLGAAERSRDELASSAAAAASAAATAAAAAISAASHGPRVEGRHSPLCSPSVKGEAGAQSPPRSRTTYSPPPQDLSLFPSPAGATGKSVADVGEAGEDEAMPKVEAGMGVLGRRTLTLEKGKGKGSRGAVGATSKPNANSKASKGAHIKAPSTAAGPDGGSGVGKEVETLEAQKQNKPAGGSENQHNGSPARAKHKKTNYHHQRSAPEEGALTTTVEPEGGPGAGVETETPESQRQNPAGSPEDQHTMSPAKAKHKKTNHQDQRNVPEEGRDSGKKRRKSCNRVRRGSPGEGKDAEEEERRDYGKKMKRNRRPQRAAAASAPSYTEYSDDDIITPSSRPRTTTDGSETNTKANKRPGVQKEPQEGKERGRGKGNSNEDWVEEEPALKTALLVGKTEPKKPKTKRRAHSARVSTDNKDEVSNGAKDSSSAQLDAGLEKEMETVPVSGSGSGRVVGKTEPKKPKTKRRASSTLISTDNKDEDSNDIQGSSSAQLDPRPEELVGTGPVPRSGSGRVVGKTEPKNPKTKRRASSTRISTDNKDEVSNGLQASLPAQLDPMVKEDAKKGPVSGARSGSGQVSPLQEEPLPKKERARKLVRAGGSRLDLPPFHPRPSPLGSGVENMPVADGSSPASTAGVGSVKNSPASDMGSVLGDRPVTGGKRRGTAMGFLGDPTRSRKNRKLLAGPVIGVNGMKSMASIRGSLFNGFLDPKNRFKVPKLKTAGKK